MIVSQNPTRVLRNEQKPHTHTHTHSTFSNARTPISASLGINQHKPSRPFVMGIFNNKNNYAELEAFIIIGAYELFLVYTVIRILLISANIATVYA